ncbi:isopenicillin N synthase family dioxygenase [Yoonia sediminilitoris]|uniref:2-oxoglutarate-dependent ethylene/succinate-forming enzyme n=1 Tax=Yoonia sediminilitoris TaxID=1286148 RepID=A0A2T6KQC8_9RHOB|nr:2OG-Fe(II) oxygenase family protein [Yoonia sediminilitoris]PUB18752.1 isopenicillin N synthase-like dioxygenase [Yoonia sediminilitoris]RCW98920.1 isopenicillin N synthase-like dioxygenase [Yoonia sediminilitoris]
MSFSTFNLAAFETAHQDARHVLATDLDRICRDTGFLLLEGHGVAQSTIDDMWAAATAFFAQDATDKRKVSPPYQGYPYGYLGPETEALARSKGEETPPDLKESFNGGPLAVPQDAGDDARAFCYQPTLWPDLPGFRPAWEAYYSAMEALAARVMRAFAAALQLPDGYFAPFIAHPISALRALHYPATDTAPLDRQQRAGAHTDYGSLTILLPQPGRKGLQVMRDDSWIDVPAHEGTFVINIGDLMARWTADRWVSTMHRVVAHPGQPPRQSLAFFHQPDWDAEITPLDGSDTYAPVCSGPYLMQKFQATGV